MMLRVAGKKLLPAFAAVAITALLGSNVAQAQNQKLVLDYLPEDTNTTDKKTGDPKMRERQMKTRQAYQRRKYAPW
jgi:hypothetical protein